MTACTTSMMAVTMPTNTNAPVSRATRLVHLTSCRSFSMCSELVDVGGLDCILMVRCFDRWGQTDIIGWRLIASGAGSIGLAAGGGFFLYLAITAPRSPLHLTALDCCSEDVRVPPIVVAELELRDVERHVFGADFVEGADNAALE